MSEPNSNTKVTVTSVWGEVKHWGDHASAWIAMHPKTAVLVALVTGNVVGVVLNV